MIENHPHDTDDANDHQMLESVGQTVPKTPSDGACDASMSLTASSQGSLNESIQQLSVKPSTRVTDVSPVSGLELTTVENTGEKSTVPHDQAETMSSHPVSGTITHHLIVSQSVDKGAVFWHSLCLDGLTCARLFPHYPMYLGA